MLKRPLRTLTPDEARLRMASLCSRAEHCRADIADRLSRHGLSPGEVEGILDFLTSHDFINDDRFAAAFVRDKVRFNGRGRLRISRELRMCGVDAATIDVALNAIDETEYFESALKVARGKARGLDLASHEDRVRLYRFMSMRGFEGPVISMALRAITDDER